MHSFYQNRDVELVIDFFFFLTWMNAVLALLSEVVLRQTM